jgi:hypothetical protein
MDANGLIKTASADQARFDHRYVNGQVESLGLLMEEQRTNLLTYSEQFDNAAWVKVASTVGINSITAPDGTTTADKLTEDNTDNIHRLGQRYTKSASAITYTLSVFVKKAERRYFEFGMTTENSFVDAFFDMDTKSFLYSAPVIFGTFVLVDYGSVNYPNDWVRVYVTATTDTLTYVDSFFGVYATDGFNTYQGDGTSGIYIWGAQLEEGYFPTSYIPTTTATVTRSQDNASMTGTNFSSWFNPSEGTTLISYDKYYQETQFDFPYYPALFLIGTWPTRISYYDFGGVYQYMDVAINENFQASLYGSSTRPTNTTLKFIGAYKENDFAAIGTERVLYTDTSGSIPSGFNTAYIGNDGLFSNTLLNGHLKQISYYPTRLSNTLLQNLTK